jgi:RHS repeat-associated protein
VGVQVYDNTYQLTAERRSGANAYAVTYTYDAYGNRTLKLDSGARTTSAYDVAAQIRRYQDSTGITTFAFDGAGNQLLSRSPTNQRTSYTWDVENRLTKVKLLLGTLETLIYNGDGMRVRRDDSSGTVKHIWDQQSILIESNGADVTTCVYTLEPSVYGLLISMQGSNGDGFYHFDGQGSATGLTNGTASITDTYIYRSFGDSVAIAGSTINPFRFVGRWGYYFDTMTGTHYIRTRHYLSDFSRFLTLDPISKRVPSKSQYSYCTNNPAYYIDPSGKQEYPLRSRSEIT